MEFLKKFAGGIKKVLGVALVSVLLSQSIAPALSANATSEPRFNFLEDDLPLIRGANKSAGETDWHNPVDGRVGDTFAGIVYYHNGVPETVAENTHVRVNLPAQTTNGKLVVGATVSASNASPVSGSMTVNLDGDATVSLIPGTVQWFPNYRATGTPAQPLLGGQSGNELVGSGLNIGPINGCWDYVGYVVFQFKTNELPQSKIIQSKIAKNLVTGEEGTDIFANPGDEVLYTLTTKNTGNIAADYVIEDNVSDILELANFVEASMGGVISGGIIRYPAVRIAAGETTIRTFKVKVMNPQPTNTQDGKHFDCTMENFYGNLVLVKIGKPGKPTLKIEKLVRNVTINEASFVKQNQAKSGDILEYKITFTNTGAKADNIVITDTLPVNTSLVSGSIILEKSGAQRNLSDNVLSDGAEIGSLSQNETGVIRFRVRVGSGVANDEILCNTAFLHFNKAMIQDTAKTKIVITPVPTKPELPMTGAETPILSLLFTTTGALYLKLRKAKSAFFLLRK